VQAGAGTKIGGVSGVAPWGELWHHRTVVAERKSLPVADFSTRRTMMVDTQVRPSDVTKFPIIDAMLSVPREDYVPTAKREAAYIGDNVDLGGGRTLLEPRTFAKMLDALNVQPAEVVLDVACGLGYSTAVLSRLADFVVAVEDDEARAEEAQSILSEHGVDNAAVIAGVLAEGAAKSGPYDVILLEGAVEEIPVALLDQLKDGGRIGCLMTAGKLEVARVGQKIDGRMNWRDVFHAGAPVLKGFAKKAAFAL
jgi:protein-L-isoaspartate(D-aspartate) O-methyltransferase